MRLERHGGERIECTCPRCKRARLVRRWRVGDVEVYACRGCERRFAHVERHRGCGLAEIEDLPDPHWDHRFVASHETPFWPCFPEPAVELACGKFT